MHETRTVKPVRSTRRLAAAGVLLSLVTACAGAGGGGDSTDAGAENTKDTKDYPSKAIEFVVPYPAGGGTDTFARTLAPYLEDELGVPVNVVIRSAGAGVAGALHVIQEPADGYVVLAGEAGVMTTGPLANPDTPYDPEQDLVGVASVTADPWVLMASAESGITSAQEFLDRTKKDPRSLKVAISGILSSDHYAWLLVQRELGFPEYSMVSYGGGGPKSHAVFGGEADAMVEVYADAEAGISDGLAVPLMVFGEERLDQLPDVPTTTELGLDGAVADIWQGVIVNSNTPDEVVERLESAVNAATENPEYRERMAKVGTHTVFRGTEEFNKVIETERRQATKIVNKISLDDIRE